MKTFRLLINIDPDLKVFFKEVEQYFSIKLDNVVVEKIFNDCIEDQVTEKNYEIFNGEKRFMKTPIQVTGKVDEYEPEDIWIEILNIKEKDVKHFQGLKS
jgi:hypothetical protein